MSDLDSWEKTVDQIASQPDVAGLLILDSEGLALAARGCAHKEHAVDVVRLASGAEAAATLDNKRLLIKKLPHLTLAVFRTIQIEDSLS